MEAELETGEEFEVRSNNGNDEINEEQIEERLKEFSFYFVTCIEDTFDFFLQLLDGRKATQKSDSNAVSALGAAASAIPYVGKLANLALTKSGTYILNRIDKKNSKILAHLVYYFNRNREEARQILIETSMELFYCYENQIMKLHCSGGSTRVMFKLAQDAANRVVNYFLKNKEIEDISKENFIKGVIYGNSNTITGKNSKKTVKNNKEKWKTSHIYPKVGIIIANDGDCEYFKNRNSKTEKYGYRRLFSWENERMIRESGDWSEDDNLPPDPCYFLTFEILKKLYPKVEEYIIRQKKGEEEAKLDQKQKHVDAMKDRQSKHEEIIKMIMAKREILDELRTIYQEIKRRIEENDFAGDERHNDVTTRLTKLQQTSDDIKHEVFNIRLSQEESTSTSEDGSTVNVVIQNNVNVTVHQYFGQKDAAAAAAAMNEFGEKLTDAWGEIKENLQEKNTVVKQMIEERVDEIRSRDRKDFKERSAIIRQNVVEAVNEIKSDVTEVVNEIRNRNRGALKRFVANAPQIVKPRGLFRKM